MQRIELGVSMKEKNNRLNVIPLEWSNLSNGEQASCSSDNSGCSPNLSWSWLELWEKRQKQ